MVSFSQIVGDHFSLCRVTTQAYVTSGSASHLIMKFATSNISNHIDAVALSRQEKFTKVISPMRESSVAMSNFLVRKLWTVEVR